MGYEIVITMNDVYVFDNIISKKEQENIIDILLKKSPEKNFNWFFKPDVSVDHNKHQKRPGFAHIFLDNFKVNSYYWTLVESIFKNTAKKLKLKNSNVIQCRSFLQLPLNEKYIGNDVDTPHLDRTDPHLVFLYYVNDNDAKTIIYNYKSKNESDIPYFEDIKKLKTIKPKKGRVVVFNGMHWHTAEQPKNDIRCIINFNVRY